MPTTPSIHEFKAWQTEVVMRCYNRAWALSVQPRNSAEDREMLDAAHTSAYHWAQVGAELNRMRATMLLAEVHALLGHGSTATSLATQMRDYFVGRSDTPDWELAFSQAVHAHCAHAAGNLALHRDAYQEVVAAIAAVADDGDREIVARTFSQVPVRLGASGADTGYLAIPMRRVPALTAAAWRVPWATPCSLVGITLAVPVLAACGAARQVGPTLEIVVRRNDLPGHASLRRDRSPATWSRRNRGRVRQHRSAWRVRP